MLALGGIASENKVIPPEWRFAVCVTTVDNSVARVDSYWLYQEEAVKRRKEIVTTGWITVGNEYDREDEYGPHSIVKATVDPTYINHQSCQTE